MNYNERDNDQFGRDFLRDHSKIGGTDGFNEKEMREIGKEHNVANERLQNIAIAALNYANEHDQDITMISESDLGSLRTWPDEDYIDLEELKDMIKGNGGYLDVTLGEDTPIRLLGAEYEHGELIMIADSGVYSTVNIHELARENQDIGREW